MTTVITWRGGFLSGWPGVQKALGRTPIRKKKRGGGGGGGGALQAGVERLERVEGFVLTL